MIQAVVLTDQRNEAGAEQSSLSIMSACPAPHKYVYIILISKVLFIIPHWANA